MYKIVQLFRTVHYCLKNHLCYLSFLALGELEVGDIIEFYTIPKYYSKYKEKVYIKNSLVRVNLLNIGFEKIEDIIKI